MTSSQSQQSSEGSWPRGTTQPAPNDTVQVLMTETMAREFEQRVLAPRAYLAGPVLFSEDDLPTYIIGVDPPAVTGIEPRP